MRRLSFKEPLPCDQKRWPKPVLPELPVLCRDCGKGGGSMVQAGLKNNVMTYQHQDCDATTLYSRSERRRKFKTPTLDALDHGTHMKMLGLSGRLTPVQRRAKREEAGA